MDLLVEYGIYFHLFSFKTYRLERTDWVFSINNKTSLFLPVVTRLLEESLFFVLSLMAEGVCLDSRWDKMLAGIILFKHCNLKNYLAENNLNQIYHGTLHY